MQERMSAKDYKALIARKGKCPTCGRGGRSKLGSVAIVDPETGTRIPSKHEMKVLVRKRVEAKAQGWITALHPRFNIEGGVYSADVVEIAPKWPATTRDYLPPCWFWALCRVSDAKGVDHAAGRKSRKQVKARFGIDVQVVKE